MKWGRWAVLAVVTVVASVATVRWSLRAQEQRTRPVRSVTLARQVSAPQPANGRDQGDEAAVAPSVQDALLRPLDLPFAEPTSLADVQKYLAGAIGVPVVLDLAALDRLDLEPADTVQLDLKGVRLKTGLKLLLDQVGMTFRVLPDDNLLLLTDATEGGEPIDRALRELKALHLEMHDLRDAIDDLRDLVEEDLGVEPDQDSNAAAFVRLTPPARRRRPTRERSVPTSTARPEAPRGGIRG